MKAIKIVAVVLSCVFICAVAFAKTGPSWKPYGSDAIQPSTTSRPNVVIPDGYFSMGPYTVATLPTPPADRVGALAVVTDGDDNTDCTTGSGTDLVVCQWTGSAWENAGDGTAEGSAEVSDADVAAAGNGDTSHAYSKDDIHDYSILGDTDLDGLPDALDTDAVDAITEIAAALKSGSDGTLITGTAGTDTYTAVWNADGDLVDGFDPASKQDALTFGIADTNALQVDATAGAPNDNEIARFTASGIEGLTYAELATATEAANEAVIDLQDLQGAVTDAQVPNTITINTATLATTLTITDNESTDEANAILFTSGGDQDGGNLGIESDGDLNYNPSTGTLAATVFSGSGASLTWAEGTLIDLSAITMSEGVDEGIAIPTYADVAPSTEKNYMAYDAANNSIMVRESGGWVNASAGSGAATSLNFIVTSAEGSLSAESVLTAGNAIDITDAGGDGGAVTVAFDPTEVSADGSDTWSDGSQASIVWTFDVSGTDHTMTAGNGLMTFGDAVTVTDTLTINGNITDGTATWNSTNQVLSGFGNITSTGVVTSTGFTIGSAAITEAELEILDGATLSTADINIIDGISESGSLTAAELLRVDGVESPIQTQLDARCLESVFGTALEADDLELNGTTLQLAAEIPHTDVNETITGNWTLSGTLAANGEITMGADFNLNAHEIQSISNIVLQLGDNAGAYAFSVQDSDGASIFSVDSDGTISQPATNNPYISLLENDGTSFYIGVHDTTTDQLEFRTSETVDTNVLMHLDANELNVAGNVDLTTGHTFQINGSQINYANLAQDGNASPTDTWDFISATLKNIGAGTVADGSNYTTISNSADDDTIDELMAAIDSWASGVSAGTLVTLSDVGGSDVYTSGYIIIADGSDSYDPKAVGGHGTLANDGTLTVVDFALNTNADAGDADITSIDKLEGYDSAVYIDMGADGVIEIEADTGVDFGTAGVRFLDDGDGAITLTGKGNGSDEALTINLDDTSNTIALSSTTGVTEMNFSSFNLVTTGKILGGVNVSSKTAATYTIGTDDSDEANGTVFINGDNDAIDFTLPSAVAGMSVCIFQANGVSGAITIQPNTGDYLLKDGSRGTAATDYVSTGDGGDAICVCAISADDWLITRESGTWSE
jgi:hypothetical protein